MIRTLYCLLIAFAVITAQPISTTAQDSDQATATESKLVPAFKDGTSIPEARGVWAAKGYGYVFEITESNARHFSICSTGGWEHDSDGFPEIFIELGETKDTSRVTLHPLEPGYNLTRLEKLPASCLQTDHTPTQLFKLFSSTMTDYYPFFKERNVDWQAKIEAHQAKVNDEMSEQELFDVFGSMLDGLTDGHVSLNAEIDDEETGVEIEIKDTGWRLKQAFANQSEIEDPQEFRGKWVKQFNDEIENSILRGEPKFACNKRLIWGRTSDRVGYLMIKGMARYSDGSLDEQVALLHKALDQALTELADTDALIIDISVNGGGMDLFSLEIASHFADKRRVGFSKWPATQKQYRDDRHVTPYTETNEDGVMYTKPVYLVTNDITASAAEIFTMCMRAFPNVKTLGKNTSGALSDVLDKTLPNGWEFGMSNEIYVDHEGVCHEGPGIPPMIPMEIFDPKDINEIGHSESIAKIKAIAEKETAKE